MIPRYQDWKEHIRKTFGFTPKPCWIADVRAEHGLTRRIANNRMDPKQRTNPCPPHRRLAIEESLRFLGMIPQHSGDLNEGAGG